MSYLYAQISSCEFSDLFARRGRSETFSYRAKIALFEYLTDLADDIGEPIQVDVIALCCEWTEYSSTAEAAEACGYVAEDPDEEIDDDEEIDARLNYLTDRTQVVTFAGGVLIQDF